MTLQVNALGPFDVLSESRASLTFPTTKAKVLFAYLALEAGQPQTREKLSSLLWGDVADARARANLRQTLTRIRQAWPAGESDLVVSNHGSIQLNPQLITTDAASFEQLISEGTITALEHAATLYRGELLDGIGVDEEPFEGWLRGERQKYRERAVACFERLLEHYNGFGASTRGIEICNRLLQLDPYREDVHRLLMNFYADQERRGAALAQFEECRTLLRDELGVEPEAETVAIYEKLRDMSVRTKFTKNPVLSRPGPSPLKGQRSSSRVTDLVGRSPWNGADWEKPSVAVLPFTTTDTAGVPVFLCDGIVDELISNLSRFSDLHVIARNSSFIYRNQELSHSRIGEELKVKFLVEGKLAQRESQIITNVQLVEARSGVVVWSDRFEESVEALSSLQNDLARQICGVVAGRIEQTQLDEMSNRPPEKWEVFECWLRGVHLLRKVNWGNVSAARSQFERALELQPDYARGYVGLALAQLKVWSCLSWTSWWKLSDSALPYAQKAFELDDSDYQIHSVLGSISLYVSDFNRARYHLNKAETLNPNDARNLANSAISWALLGEAERGVRNAEMAVRLDPFHPDWYMAALGFAYYGVKDYERAIAAMEVASDGQCDTRAYLAASYAQIGDLKSAKVHADEFIRHSCEQLGGDPVADFQQYIDGQVASNPYERAEDKSHFIEGLRLAGLPTSLA